LSASSPTLPVGFCSGRRRSIMAGLLLCWIRRTEHTIAGEVRQLSQSGDGATHRVLGAGSQDCVVDRWPVRAEQRGAARLRWTGGLVAGAPPRVGTGSAPLGPAPARPQIEPGPARMHHRLLKPRSAAAWREAGQALAALLIRRKTAARRIPSGAVATGKGKRPSTRAAPRRPCVHREGALACAATWPRPLWGSATYDRPPARCWGRAWPPTVPRAVSSAGRRACSRCRRPRCGSGRDLLRCGRCPGR
jgi:hypothetical protein